MSQSSGAMVDVYDLDRINSIGDLDMGQDKIIVMALLCGCDYCPDGVDGVGKDGAMKLMRKYSDKEIMNVIQGWRYERSKFEEFERKVSDTTICNNCGHHGKQVSHTKKGCGTCNTHQGCTATIWR